MLNIKAFVKNTLDIKKIQNMATLSRVRVLVGIPGGLTHTPKNQSSTSIETSELAKSLSFGANGIPPRPFLQDGIRENRESIKKVIASEIKKYKSTGTCNFNIIGTYAAGKIKYFVMQDSFYQDHAPNSTSTIKAKGSTRPLIDTGEMVNSITYQVVKK